VKNRAKTIKKAGKWTVPAAVDKELATMVPATMDQNCQRLSQKNASDYPATMGRFRIFSQISGFFGRKPGKMAENGAEICDME